MRNVKFPMRDSPGFPISTEHAERKNSTAVNKVPHSLRSESKLCKNLLLKVTYHSLYSMNKFVTNKSKLPHDGAQVFPYME